MGRATGCSDRQENHFGFQSVSPSYSCPRRSRKPNVLRLSKKPQPFCGMLRLDLGMNSLDALTLSQSTDHTRANPLLSCLRNVAKLKNGLTVHFFGRRFAFFGKSPHSYYKSAAPSYNEEQLMKRCAQCHRKLGLSVRFRNIRNGHWWVHVRFLFGSLRSHYEVKRNNAVKHRWHAFLAHGNSRS